MSKKAVHQIVCFTVNDLVEIATNDRHLASCNNRRAEGTVHCDTDLFANVGRVRLEGETCYNHVRARRGTVVGDIKRRDIPGELVGVAADTTAAMAKPRTFRDKIGFIGWMEEMGSG